MKRMFIFIVIILTIVAVRHDLTTGSLSMVNSDVIAQMEQEDTLPFFEQTIMPGDTLISIVETNVNGPIPVPIGELITDFQLLNGNEQPEMMQIGKTYHFPHYKGE